MTQVTLGLKLSFQNTPDICFPPLVNMEDKWQYRVIVYRTFPEKKMQLFLVNQTGKGGYQITQGR